MSSHGEEIFRFSQAGKTFFFNDVEARNGRHFGGINTMWGQGNKERVVIFPEQMLQFYRGTLKMVEHFTGLSPKDKLEKPLEKCYECGEPKSKLGVLRTKDLEDFLIYCGECRSVLLETRDGIHKKIKEEQDDSTSI